MATPFRVLVGIDFSETTSKAFEYALEEVRKNEPAELHVLSVVDDGTMRLFLEVDHHETLTKVVDGVRDRLTKDTAGALERFRGTRPGATQSPAIIHVRMGAIADQIAAVATEIRADLLVVGSHGTSGFRHFMMGSVAERAVRLAPCPVLVVRAKNFSAMEGLPEIEPPCPACVTTREASNGAEWWCSEHRSSPTRAHTYAFSGRLDPHTPLNHML